VSPAPAAADGAADRLQKQLEAQTAEVAKLREARAAKPPGTPDYDAANASVQAMKQEISKTEAALAEARKSVAAAPAPPLTEVEKARAALAAADAGIAAAKRDLLRWERAQAFMTVHVARTTFAEKERRFQELAATAKDALQPAEQVRNDLAAAEKKAAEAPAELAQAKTLLAQATAAVAPLNQAIGAAEARLAEKQATAGEIVTTLEKASAAEAELAKKLEQQTAEIARRRQARSGAAAGTPEYTQADQQVQAMKPELAQTEAALAASKAQVAELKPKAAAPKAELTRLQAELDAARGAAKAAAEAMEAAAESVAKTEAAGTKAPHAPRCSGRKHPRSCGSRSRQRRRRSKPPARRRRSWSWPGHTRRALARHSRRVGSRRLSRFPQSFPHRRKANRSCVSVPSPQSPGRSGTAGFVRPARRSRFRYPESPRPRETRVAAPR
jgi:DNA repair exonuclease SbcCD ATPase subunit